MAVTYRKIPWVGIDCVEDWFCAELNVVNTAPEIDSVDNPPVGDIVFCLMNTNSLLGPILPNTVDVWVNGVQYVTAGVGTNGAIYNAAWTGAGGIDLICTITPPVAFDSGSTVTVEVFATSVPDVVHEIYDFHIVDYVDPQLVSAVGWWDNKIRVTFNEAVSTGSETAANYVLVGGSNGNRGIALPAIASAVALSPTVVELTAEYRLSPGAEYVLTVASVEDVAGNTIDPAHNTATFSAYDFRDLGRIYDGWQLYRQLSDGDRASDHTKDLEKFCTARQYWLDVALREADDLHDLTNPDWCSESYLDALLFDLGDPLPFVTDVRAKRRIAWHAAGLHKKRGTAPGIELAVQLVTGITGTVVLDRDRRWILGHPTLSKLCFTTRLGGGASVYYSFWVDFTVHLTAAERVLVQAAAEAMKTAHTHYLGTIEPP